MKDYLKISIVTPCYNFGSYLEATILSVLNQDYPNLEYIIIDGGSTDNTIDIIRKYEHKITKWISEPDNGLYDALNKGFSYCSGDIMSWINADDLYHPGSFSIINEVFTNYNQVSWLLGSPSHFDELGRVVKILPFRKWSKIDFFLNDYKWLQQESIFWRKHLWQCSGGYVSTKYLYASDFELWNRFFQFSNLTVTTALLAGFRTRSSGQLSVKFIVEYENEVKDILHQSLLSLKSSNFYKYLYIIMLNFLRTSKIKILRYLFNKLFNKLKKHNFLNLYKDCNIIIFNSTTQNFKLYD